MYLSNSVVLESTNSGEMYVHFNGIEIVLTITVLDTALNAQMPPRISSAKSRISSMAGSRIPANVTLKRK